MDELNSPWQRWLIDNLLLGKSRFALEEALKEQGLSALLAKEALEVALRDPLVIAIHQEREAHARLERKLECLSRLRQSSSILELSKEDFHPEAFFRDHYGENRPVLIRGYAAEWPAVKLWSPAYFAEHYPNIPIEIASDREQSIQAERSIETHRKPSTLGEFSNWLLSGQGNNNDYCVANNRNADKPEFEPLLSYLPFDARLFSPTHERSARSFWYGSAKTITSWHHDPTNVFFTQIFGSKRWSLLSPLDHLMLQGSEGYFHRLGTRSPILGEDCLNTPFVVQLDPGDALFVPALWWHHVEALGTSISFSRLHFTHSNRFPDYRP